jgi:hypothetical protein
MNEILTYSILLVAVVLAGGLVVQIWGNKLIKHLNLLLAFGGAYLIGLVFLHLVPEVFQGGGGHNHGHDHAAHSAHLNPGWFVLIGFILQIILEFFSDGIEHGHFHSHKSKRAFPLAAFFSLCAHGFIEAMPLAGGAHHHHDHGHLNIEGAPLLVGIMIHTFPVAMVLAGLLLAAGLKKTTQWFYLVVFALMPVFGMLLSDQLLHLPGIDAAALLTALSGVLIGILLHISTTMLFETSDGHRFNLTKMLTILSGLLLAAVTLG